MKIQLNNTSYIIIHRENWKNTISLYIIKNIFFSLQNSEKLKNQHLHKKNPNLRYRPRCNILGVMSAMTQFRSVVSKTPYSSRPSRPVSHWVIAENGPARVQCTAPVQFNVVHTVAFVWVISFFLIMGRLRLCWWGIVFFDSKLMWALIKLQFDVANTFEIIGDSLVFNCILKLIFFGFRSLIDWNKKKINRVRISFRFEI